MKLNLKIGVFAKVAEFFKRLGKSVRLTTFNERVFLVVLAIILGILVYCVANERFVKQTVLVSDYGGEYKEALVGDVKYLSPYAVKTDAEKSISRLIYSSLVKIDKKGELVGDLAKDWSVSESGLEYRFNLRQNVVFHDGSTFEATDVIDTVNYIKDSENKSPLYESWKDIMVVSEGDYTVVFTLPHSYGPFIYLCTLGISNSDDLYFSSLESVNGTGPYYYVEMTDNIETKVKSVKLQSNQSYHGGMPYIESFVFDLYSEDDINQIDKSNYTAFANFNFEGKDYLNLDFGLGRNIVMLANLRREFIANDDNRSKIFNYQAFDEIKEISILTQDNEVSRAIVEEFVDKHKNSNINFKINYLLSVDYAEAVTAREYDLLIYGCNFGYDRDLYTFWHSSQVDYSNFSGYADKDSDIFLEDTRFTFDGDERNSRYDQFCEKVKEKNLVKIYPAITFNYKVNFDLKGVDIILGKKPEDRFNTVSEWYLNEKRVRK